MDAESHSNVTGVPSVFWKFQEIDWYREMPPCDGNTWRVAQNCQGENTQLLYFRKTKLQTYGNVFQKILKSSKHCHSANQSFTRKVSSLWNTFVVQVLGLKPIPDAKKNIPEHKVAVEDDYAFELLRVILFLCLSKWHKRLLFPNFCRSATALHRTIRLAATETSTSKFALGSPATPRKGTRSFAACQ